MKERLAKTTALTAIVAALMIISCLECQGADKAARIGSAHATDSSYTLVWHDEFSGKKLDRSKWIPVDDTVVGKYGHGNGEAQAYVDAEGETFYVKDGRLTIVAHHAPGRKYPLRKEPGGKVTKLIGHQPFRSAKITSEKLASFTYGIIEAKIKNPTDATGKRTAVPTWPAFWLMPEAKTAPYSGYWDKAAADNKRKWAHSSWPYSGEIDVMEMSGRTTRLYHAGAVYHKSPRNWTVGHVGWYSHYRRFDGAIDPKQWVADQVLDGSLQPRPGEGSYPQDYHVYGCKWTKKKIIFRRLPQNAVTRGDSS